MFGESSMPEYHVRSTEGRWYVYVPCEEPRVWMGCKELGVWMG